MGQPVDSPVHLRIGKSPLAVLEGNSIRKLLGIYFEVLTQVQPVSHGNPLDGNSGIYDKDPILIRDDGIEVQLPDQRQVGDQLR